MFIPGVAVVFICVFVIYIIAGGNIMIILAATPPRAWYHFRSGYWGDDDWKYKKSPG